MADQLETMFRELAEAPGPTGLRAATDVRRRGDHRRRTNQATALVAVAVLAVVGVAVTDSTRHRDEHNQVLPGGPLPTASPVQSLAADPLLVPGDVPRIGPYTVTKAVGPADSTDTDGLPLACPGATLSNVALQQPGQRIETQGYVTDLEATFTETVALFNDAAAADRAMYTAIANCMPGTLDDSTTSQTAPLDGLEGRQVGTVTLPPGDGGIGYLEYAVAREQNLVVVLEWSSMGLPHGEKLTPTTTSWQFAWTEQVVQRALDRATDVSG